MDNLFYQYHQWLNQRYYEAQQFNLDDPIFFGRAMAFKECVEKMIEVLRAETKKQQEKYEQSKKENQEKQ